LNLTSHVLNILNDSTGLERVLVVGAPDVLSKLHLARKCVGLVDSAGTLNGALTIALEECSRHSVAALVVPCDLPFLDKRDVARIVQLWREGHRVVICPSCHGGTNGLLVDYGVDLRPAFGPDSYRRHVELAEAAGARPAVLVTENLSFDLDTPEQWYSLPAHLRQQLLSGVAMVERGEQWVQSG
jgi:2-phospho-L-lactate guanylyltransferase